MKIALDTNRYRDFCVGDPTVLERIQLAEQVVIAALVVEHGLHLFSRDHHFNHLPHLLRVD